MREDKLNFLEAMKVLDLRENSKKFYANFVEDILGFLGF